MKRFIIALILAASPAFAGLENTWVTAPNNTLDTTSVTTSSKNELWYYAAALTGNTAAWANATGGAALANPWMMWCSSNGATAPSDQCQTDHTDRVHASGSYTVGDWVRAAAGSAHSWYVLKSAAFGGYPAMYMLVDWSTATDQTVTISFSKTNMLCAASPCTTLTAPTAADIWTHTSFAFNPNSIASQNRLHFSADQYGSFWFMPSRDGAGFTSNPLVGVFLKDYKSADVIPFLSAVSAPCAAFNATANLWSDGVTAGQGFQGRKFDNSGAASNAVITPIIGNPNAGMFSNSKLAGTDGIDSKWDDFPAYVFDNTTTGLRGRLPDFRLAPATLPSGSVGPSTPPYTNVGVNGLGSCSGTAAGNFTSAWLPYANSTGPTL